MVCLIHQSSNKAESSLVRGPEAQPLFAALDRANRPEI